MDSLADFRNKTGLSQAQLAEWLGISRALVGHVETGQRTLPTPALLRLSQLRQLLKDLPPMVSGDEAPITFPKQQKATLQKAALLELDIQRLQLEIKDVEAKMTVWQTALKLCRTLKALDWVRAEMRLLDSVDRFHQKTWIAWCEHGPRELRRLQFYLYQKQEEKAFVEALASAYSTGEL